MYRSFESIKNCQRCDFLKIFVIPGGNATPHKFQRGDTSAPLPNRSGRYQGTTPTTWLNFNTPCKSQPTILPYYRAFPGVTESTVWCLQHKVSTAYPTGGHVTQLEHHRRGRPVLLGAVVHQQVQNVGPILTKLLEVLSTVPLFWRMHVASRKPREAGRWMNSEEAGQSRPRNTWDLWWQRIVYEDGKEVAPKFGRTKACERCMSTTGPWQIEAPSVYP